MCTSISYKRNDFYFGRNLDVEFSFNEKVVITPSNYYFKLSNGQDFNSQYALIGIAAVVGSYPLYYEAVNEKGLAIAGLNFPKNAYYLEPKENKHNIAPFEFVPWLLGSVTSVKEARELLKDLNLTNIRFEPNMPLSPLHWMISDKEESIIVEPLEEGVKVYDNPYDVLTNNPPFQYHLWNMHNYINLSPENGTNEFSEKYNLSNYGVGMGSIGLPGDTSSASRFVRAAFNLTNSNNEDKEELNVAQFFHVLDSVAMLKGSTITDDDKNDITLYSCCINASKGIYYYKTYDNNRINAISLNEHNKHAKEPTIYPLNLKQDINYLN